MADPRKTDPYWASLLRGLPAREPEPEPLPDAQQNAIRELEAQGPRSARLLSNGDVEVRVSATNGRFEYVITPSGQVTQTLSLPPLESRKRNLGGNLGCLGGIWFLVWPVLGVLSLLEVIEITGWLGRALFAVSVVAFGLVAIGFSMEDEAVAEDSFMRRESGQRASVSSESLPVDEWIDIGTSSYDDSVGDGNGDGD